MSEDCGTGRFIRKGFADEVTFQPDSEAGMGRGQSREEQENIPDGGKEACQGPEPGFDVFEEIKHLCG